MSTMKTEIPSVFFSTCSIGVVRASSTIRSECSARDVQIFWPLTTQPFAVRSARVVIFVVSDPASGSVTPNACSRSSPDAIRGSHCCFCASLPCRSNVPITYICAWQAPGLPPDALISSRIVLAAPIPSPDPPYCSGISAASQPCSVSARTNSVG